MQTHRPLEVTLNAFGTRRWVGLFALSLLAFLVFFLALSTPMSWFWRGALVAIGAGFGWLAYAMYCATCLELHWDGTALRLSSGDVLVRFDDIVTVERGLFEFKPTNGFVIGTKNKLPPAWAPGLYWRVGRKIGVGGVTNAGQARVMADAMRFTLERRTHQHSDGPQ